MSSVSDHLNKVREQRVAREKARIDKLRELNLKKYTKTEEPPTPRQSSSVSVLKNDVRKSQFNFPKNNITTNINKRPITAPGIAASATNLMQNASAKSSNLKISNNIKAVKSNVTIKKPEYKPWNYHGKLDEKTKPIEKRATFIGDSLKRPITATKSEHSLSSGAHTNRNDKGDSAVTNKPGDVNLKRPITATKSDHSLSHGAHTSRNDKGDSAVTNKPGDVKNDPRLSRKSFIPKSEAPKPANAKPKPQDSRKSIHQPKASQSAANVNPNRQSVFDRLYQPKMRFEKKNVTDSEKIQNDPNFLKKIIKNTGLILNKRHTVFETRKPENVAPRRSISAVHFRRISKNELPNCMHKWSSIGEKLDKVHLNDINEDAAVKGDRIVSAVKSERKKVKFQTPIYNFNTPKPEELQSKLQDWLHKRGKSINSYHHLQCFGIHHLAQKEIRPLNLEVNKFEEFNDEDKENKPVESDSDNDSYEDVMNSKSDNDTVVDLYVDSSSKIEKKDCLGNDLAKDGWRRASYVSECVTDLNETQESMLTSIESPHVDELLLGALNDLTELLREGFDWEQCARWLRAIRERFPSVPATAFYWECRAALEERRGDFPASVQCLEEAIVKGSERSVVEANLDQLLEKFMQLRISPRGGKRRAPDPKLLDVKNMFKSTLIRFAVQKAKLRQSEEPKFTVTPVRRSGRLSAHWSARRTPLQECTTLRQAGLLVPQHPIQFVPNDKLCETP